MLKFSRAALGRLGFAAALALVAATLAAASRLATETTLRDGVVERLAERRTTDGGEVWESGGDFNGVFRVQTAQTGALNGGEKPVERRVVERFRADFDERLRVGATEFWASRRLESGADVALRAVADGWARWNVGPEATARFLETLTASERTAFERRRRDGAAFDFAAERAAASEASKEASASLTALKAENERNEGDGAEFDGGVDAALAFLRSLDGSVDATRGDGNGETKSGETGGEAFLWAATFDGNPLNAVGALAASDVVAISVPADLSTVRSAFASAATFFFLSTFGAFGGASPQIWTSLLGGVGENRREREFWRLLDAAFRRCGVALERLRLLLYFARLALFNAFRRFAVEDGDALKRTLADLCASTRLLI